MTTLVMRTSAECSILSNLISCSSIEGFEDQFEFCLDAPEFMPAGAQSSGYGPKPYPLWIEREGN